MRRCCCPDRIPAELQARNRYAGIFGRFSFRHRNCNMVGGSKLELAHRSLLIGAVIPFTLIVILPTNRRLLDPALNPTSDSALQLLRHWGRLHSVRAVLSLAAFGFFAGAMISGRHCDTPVWVSGDSVLGARESVLRQDLFMLRLLVSQ